MTPWGSCSMRWRRATGSTPNPPRPFTTVMSSPSRRSRNGTAGLSTAEETRPTRASTLRGSSRNVSGTSRVPARPRRVSTPPAVGARLEGLLHGPLNPRPGPERGPRGPDAGVRIVGPLDHDRQRHELPGAVAHRLLDLRGREAADVHARHAHLVGRVAAPVIDGQRRAHAHDQQQGAHRQEHQAQPRVEPPPSPPAACGGAAGRGPRRAASSGLTASRDLAHSARL